MRSWINYNKYKKRLSKEEKKIVLTDLSNEFKTKLAGFIEASFGITELETRREINELAHNLCKLFDVVGILVEWQATVKEAKKDNELHKQLVNMNYMTQLKNQVVLYADLTCKAIIQKNDGAKEQYMIMLATLLQTHFQTASRGKVWKATVLVGCK